MTERREFLERIKRQVPAPGLDEMFARNERKARAERMRAGVVGLAITAAVVVGLVAAFGGLNHGVSPAAGGVSPSDTPNMVAGPGEFYYRDIGYYVRRPCSSPPTGPCEGHQTPQPLGALVGPFNIQNWLATDGSGRLVFEPPAVNGDMFEVLQRKHPVESTSGPADVTYGPDASPMTLVSGDGDTLVSQGISPGAPSPIPQPLGSAGPESPLTVPELQVLHLADNVLVTDLAWGMATPKIQADLFRIIRDIQGVVEEPAATDPAGRPSTSLTVPLADSSVAFFFDPATQQLSAFEWADSTGEVWELLIVRSAGVVDSTTSVPAETDNLVAPVDETKTGLRTGA